jgi:hypothetical protein
VSGEKGERIHNLGVNRTIKNGFSIITTLEEPSLIPNHR